MIKKYAEDLGFNNKTIEYFYACLEEMDCVDFVEQLIEHSNKQGYDVGYEDGFEAGEQC